MLYKTLPLTWNVILSIFVIRFYSEDLWGEFIQVTLLVTFLLTIISWGNKDFLIREFSNSPSKLVATWRTSMATRLLLNIPAILVILAFPFQPSSQGLIITWVLLLSVNNSFESIILYQRDFKFASITEILGFIMLLLTLYLFREMLTLASFLAGQIVSGVVRFLLLGVYYRKFIDLKILSCINFHHLKVSSTFFLPTLIGYIETRADSYIVAFSMSASTLAKYHIFINFILLIRHLLTFLFLPYLKNFYRAGRDSWIPFQQRVIQWTPLILIFYTLAIFLIMSSVYHFEFPLYFYGLAFVLNFPFFSYQPKIFRLYQENHQHQVVKVILISAIMEIALGVAFIPAYGIVAALIINLFVQFFLLIYLHRQSSALLSNR